MTKVNVFLDMDGVLAEQRNGSQRKKKINQIIEELKEECQNDKK